SKIGIQSILQQCVSSFAQQVSETLTSMHGITLCARLADTEQSPTVFSGISVYSHFFGSVQGFYLVALDHAAVSETFGTDLNDTESTSDFFDFMREALNVSCGQAIPFLEPMFGQLTYSPS